MAILTREPEIFPTERVATAPTPKIDAAKAVSRRGPSAADRVFESARSVWLEAEAPVPPPSHLPVELVVFWQSGAAEAGAIVEAREEERLNDLAMQAEADAMLSSGTAWL